MPQENHPLSVDHHHQLTDQFMAVSLQLSKEEAHPLDRLIQLDERYQRTLLQHQQQQTVNTNNHSSHSSSGSSSVPSLENVLHAPGAKEYSQMTIASLQQPSSQASNSLLDPSHLISTYGQLTQSPSWSTPSWYHPFADSSTTAAAAFLSGYGSAAATLVPAVAGSPTAYNPYLNTPFGSFGQLTVCNTTTSSTASRQSTVTSLVLPTSLGAPPARTGGLRRAEGRSAAGGGGGKMVGTRTLEGQTRTTGNNAIATNTTTTKSSCECPNCSELQRAGIPVDKKKEKHSCHIPGCMKVYGKSSHLKAHLRWHCVERPSALSSSERIAEIDTNTDFKINLLKALCLFHRAWRYMRPDTLANCFLKAGFIVDGQKLSRHPEAEYDSDSEEVIIDEEEPVQSVVTTREAIEGFKLFQRYVETNFADSAVLGMCDKLDELLTNERLKKMKQKIFFDYFTADK